MPPFHYDRHYGVGLLDDLHNYFPALLYEQTAFITVSDVLRYISQETSNRFNLFTTANNNYSNTMNPRSNQQPIQFSGTPLRRPQQPRNVQPSTPRRRHRQNTNSVEPQQYLYSYLDMNTAGNEPILNIANSVLQAFLNTHPTELQSVVVRPTAQQIQDNTTIAVGNIASNTDPIQCSICLQELGATQEGRKINHCGHWFHSQCIDTWFQTNVRCPVCRHDVREYVTT